MSDREELFKKSWDETNGGCDEPSAKFWFEEGWQLARAESAQRPSVIKKAMANAALILANFSPCEFYENDTLKRKLTEWQACYAKLFTQMNDLVNQRPAVAAWQPIETAPKDGEGFLAYEDGDIYRARHIKDGGEWIIFSRCGQPVVYPPEPTHWMPLPKPPTSKI